MLAEIDGADAHAADRDRALENARQAVLGLQPALTSDELDALVTGLALDHNLAPVALQISAPTAPALPGSGDALPDPPEASSLSMRQVSGTVEGSRADCLALLDELARRRPAAACHAGRRRLAEGWAAGRRCPDGVRAGRLPV